MVDFTPQIDFQADTPPGSNAPNTALQDHFTGVFKDAVAANAGPDGEAKPFTFADALKAGWQNSITGLEARKTLPDTTLPENASWYQRIASQSATLAGDAPTMLEGAGIGLAGGMAAGGPLGSAIGATGGAFALPAAMRRIMIDHYKNGDIQTPGQFLERASGAMIDAAKGFLTGAATEGVGGIAEGLGAGAVTTTAAQLGTMVTVSKGLEGHLPGLSDFEDGAVMMFGLKAAELGASKLMDIYAATGKKPADIAQDMTKQPTLAAELVSNSKVPATYDPLVENPAEAAGQEVEKPQPPPPFAPESDEGAAYQNILGKIQVGGEAAAKTPVYSFDKFYADWVDNLAPVKDLVDAMTGGKQLPAADDPYKLFRNNRGGYERANQFITDATVGFKDYAPNGDSLADVLAPVKDDLDGLRVYATAKRALELEGRGIQSGFDPASAKLVVDKMGAKFDGVATGLTGYLNRVTAYARDAGLIDGDTYKTFAEMNKNYVPFNRVLPEADNDGPGTPAGNQTRKPVKTIMGSDKDVIDPIETAVKNTYQMLALAERNNALNKLMDVARRTGNVSDTGVFQKVAKKIEVTNVSNEELSALITKNGQNKATIGNNPGNLPAAPGQAAAAGVDVTFNPEMLGDLPVFRAMHQPLADNEFAVFNKGEREVYSTDSPELVTALKGMPSSMNGPVFKFVSGFSRVFRAGTVLNPSFLPVHIERQNINAFMNSPTGMLPIWSALKGAADMAGDKNAELLQQWRSSGGMNSEITAWDRRYVQNSISDLEGNKGLMQWIEDTKDDPMSLTRLPYNGVQSALDLAHTAIATHDNFLRFAQFKASMEDLASKGVTGKDAIIEAGYQSREVLLDNFRRGARMQAVNQIWAFSNLRVQGIDKLARRFQEAPEQTAWKIGAGIAIPSMLLWWANYDDPRYKETQDWQRDNFWIIPTDDWRAPRPGDIIPEMSGMSRDGPDGKEYNFGNTYRISKPQESGLLFGSSLERFLDFAHSRDPQTALNLAKSFKDALVPEVVPSMLMPVYESWANKSMFTGGPIVPASSEGLLPAYQQTNYTTELAKALGRIVGSVPGMADSNLASPPMIENYVRQWSGGLGMYALQLADKGLRAAGVLPDPTKPETALADIPFVRSFVMRFPTASTESITNFYTQYDHEAKVYATIQMLAKSGNFQAATAMAAADPLAQGKLDGVRAALTVQQKTIQALYANPDMPSAAKRQLIDAAYYQMISIAQNANALMKDQVAALKGDKK